MLSVLLTFIALCVYIVPGVNWTYLYISLCFPLAETCKNCFFSDNANPVGDLAVTLSLADMN